jgi:PAS domain S-box-containing protein
MWPDKNIGRTGTASVMVGVRDHQRHSGERSSDGGGIDTFTPFFERSGICMVRLDSELRVCAANQDFCRHLGMSAAEAKGTSIFGLVHRSGHERLRRQFCRVLEGRRTRVIERVLVFAPNLTPRPCRLTIVAVDDAGTGSSLVLLFEPDNVATLSEVVTEDTKILNSLDARILEGIAAGVSTVGLASKCYLSRQGVEYRVGMMLRRMRVLTPRWCRRRTRWAC